MEKYTILLNRKTQHYGYVCLLRLNYTFSSIQLNFPKKEFLFGIRHYYFKNNSQES